jgi:cytochrome P450
MSTSHDTDVALVDLLDPAFRVDSPEVRAAADANWWARTPIGLAVLRYQDCVALLRDRNLRHGSLDVLIAQGVSSGPFFDWLGSMLLNLEGEPHQRLRRLVSAAFTQRRVELLRPVMRSTTRELVGTFAATGGCEFMAAFADPYPARIIAALLGIPEEQFDAFLGWATDMGLGFSTAAATELPRIEAALAGLYACCDELVARRRREPGEDLISALVTAADSEGHLTGEELRILVSTLVFGGQDTTRNQLGLAMTTFAGHPRQWRLLGERPELAPTAVEEVMRVNTFGDAPFDITVQRPAQLTFGGGVHYCLGAWLARMEMREALPVLAARMPDLTTAGPIDFRPPVGITGPITLPLRFTPTPHLPEPRFGSEWR